MNRIGLSGSLADFFGINDLGITESEKNYVNH
jgi:hypothetical protein